MANLIQRDVRTEIQKELGEVHSYSERARMASLIRASARAHTTLRQFHHLLKYTLG